jgi:4,5-dihydroxyphthalate decarboxylase
MAETSASSYVVAKDQGQAVTALPVFLHRRFRHGFVFINTTKGIKKPSDLIGRKVGIKSFLVTAGHWMRGILEHEYGVPHKSVEYFAELDEDIEFTPLADLKITRLPHAKSVETMLAEGELDAVIHSSIIKPFAARDPRVGRLFPDFKNEEIAYYKKTGIFPIMHVLGLKQEIVDKHPWVPINMFQAFQRAKAIAMARMANPRIVPLAWYREAWEEQEQILGPDPWEYGLGDKNRHTIETLAGYSHEQGLTRRRLTADDLFVSVFQGRKRGDEFRI